MARTEKEETIKSRGLEKWTWLMGVFADVRETHIQSSPEFEEEFNRHYDALLDKIIEISERQKQAGG